MIDQTAPTVMIMPTAIGSAFASNGSSFTATFTFNELVTGFTEADITGLTGGTLVAGSLRRMLMNGSTVVTNPMEPAQVHTVLITPNAGATEITFTLAADVVMDVAGNNNAAYDGDPETALDQPHTITVDTVAPTPVITGPASYAGPIVIMITFVDDADADPLVEEEVTGFDAGDVAVVGGDKGSFIAVSESQYQLNIMPTGTTDITVDIPENAAMDAAGNQSPAAEQFTITYDATLPHIVSIDAPDVASGEFTVDDRLQRSGDWLQ